MRTETINEMEEGRKEKRSKRVMNNIFLRSTIGKE